MNQTKVNPPVVTHYNIYSVNGQLPFVVSHELPQEVVETGEVKARAKESQQILERFYRKRFDEKKADRIMDCGTYLLFEKWNDPGNMLRLNKANHCKDRFCLMCQYIKAGKQYQVLHTALKLAQCDGWRLQFITLTAPNVNGRYLKRQIKVMRKAQRAMFERFECLDYHSNLEVTVNLKNRTFHPHLHTLLLCRDGCYLEHQGWEHLKELRKVWYKHLIDEGVYNMPKVDKRGEKIDYAIMTTYPQDTENDKIIAELSKYITKPDVIQDDTVGIIVNQMMSMRQQVPSGKMREYIKKAKHVNELAKVEKDNYLADYYYELLMYIWNGENYMEITQE